VCGASPNIRLDLMINRMVWSALTRGYVEIANPEVQRPILAMKDLLHGVADIIDDYIVSIPAGIHNLATANVRVGPIGMFVADRLGVKVKKLPATQAYDFSMQLSGLFMPQESITSIVDDLIENHGEQWKKEAVK